MFRRFNRRKRNPRPAPGGSIYTVLRDQLLHLDPAEVGLDGWSDSGDVWAAMMETGYPKGTATLVCLRDGTTSLYTSTGGGIVGGGAHPAVVAANHAFIRSLAEHLDQLRPEASPQLPVEGYVILRALTYEGHLAGTAREDDLGHQRHPLSQVFLAAHAVVTRLRLIQEQPRRE